MSASARSFLASDEQLALAQALGRLGYFEYFPEADRASWSEELRTIWGLSPEGPGLSGREFVESIHPDDRASMALLGCTETQGVPHRFEARIVRADGCVRHVQGIVSRDSVEGVARVFGAIQDVTELRETEQRVKETQARLLQAARLARLGHWEFDASSRTLSVSDELRAMYELGPEVPIVTAAQVIHLVHPEDRAGLLELQADSSWEQTSHDFRVVLPSGRVRLMHEDIVRSVDGGARKTFGAVQDITEQREEQQRKAHRQRLESLGTLAGGIAHELNNLIHPIVGQCELGLRRLAQPESLERSLGIIRESAMKAGELVHGMLRFARRKDFDRYALPFGATVEKAVALVGPSQPTSIRVGARIDDAESLVSCNETELTQVLLHLVSNAADAMGPAGQVDIHVERVAETPAAWAVPKPNRGVLRLCVRDHGCGMDEATRTRIFDPFFTTKPVGHGTGIGMSLTYGIVKAWDGHIEVRSVPGEGTEVSLFVAILP